MLYMKVGGGGGREGRGNWVRIVKGWGGVVGYGEQKEG